MALKAQIKDDMKAVLLGGDRFVGETLRNLCAAILDEEVKLNKRDEDLSDEGIEKVIVREVKKRTESAKVYRDNSRLDLAEPEEKEIQILQKYLPEQLDEATLTSIVEVKIAELGASDSRMMGQVIGAVKKQVGNTADGVEIARIVKQKLN